MIEFSRSKKQKPDDSEDIFIHVMRVAKSHIGETITLYDLENELNKKYKYNINNIHLRHSLYPIFKFVFGNHDFNKEPHNNYIMSGEAYVRLLEYDELQEAREASKSANIFARKANIFSLLAVVLALLTFFLQLFTDLQIKI
ncbi:MAG: hypothetical protein AAF363_06350 [Bacteroidota bacterium]